MKKALLAVLFCFSTSVIAAGPAESSGTVKLSATAGLILVSLSSSNSGCGNKYYLKPDTDYNKDVL